MTPEELENTERKLQQAIEQLEQQTRGLKEDLAAIRQHIAGSQQQPGQSQAQVQKLEKLKELEKLTEGQLKENAAFLGELKEDLQQKPADAPLVSRLERETLNMLNRMQQKVTADEELSDLYQKHATGSASQTGTTTQQTDKSGGVEQQRTSPRQEPEQGPANWKAGQDMEKTVERLRQQDALDELKKKLKGGK